MKRCCMCKTEKTPELFYKDRSQKDGLSSRCKECNKLHNAQRRKINKEKKIPVTDDIQKMCLKCRHCGQPTRAVYLKLSDHEKMKDKFLCNYCMAQVENDGMIYDASTSKRVPEIRPSELPFISS